MPRRGFSAKRDGVRLRLNRNERDVLADLLGQLEQFVAPEDEPEASDDPLARMVGIAPHAQRPTDPALLRLLPDAYRDDDEAAGDFRRYTERDLREQKAANARLALSTLQGGDDGRDVEMGLPEGRAWLVALNDVRLALGVRLGVADEDDGDRDPLYDWLTWLQATLVDALMP